MIYNNQSTEKKNLNNMYIDNSPDDGSKENIDQNIFQNKNNNNDDCQTVKKSIFNNQHRRYNSEYQTHKTEFVFSANQKPQINSDSKQFQSKFQSPPKVKKFQVEIGQDDIDFNENIFMQEEYQQNNSNWFIKDGTNQSFMNDIRQQQKEQFTDSSTKTIQNQNLNISTNSSQHDTFLLECNEQFSQQTSSQKQNLNNYNNNQNSINKYNCQDELEQSELEKQQQMFNNISKFGHNYDSENKFNQNNEYNNNPFIDNIEQYQDFNQNNYFKNQMEESESEQSESSESEGNQGFDQETLLFLMGKEAEYAPDCTYIGNKQNNITVNMRGVLLDWVMEVCMEFLMKRETYHIAVNIIDRYLSLKPNILKKEFQLIGVTAMIIASKQEEIYPPRIKDFIQSTDNGYSEQQVLQCECEILQELKWQINPPTLNTWSNWYMVQWDLYISNSPFALNHPITANSPNIIQFKQPNESSYGFYREFMQIVDTIQLDYESLQYKPRAILASVMYLVLGKNYGIFTAQNIFQEFQNSSQFLISDQNMINSLFSDFLSFSFGFQLYELLQTIQYVASFFILPINIDLPTAAKINKKQVLEGHFEDFLAYQTHNSDSLQCVNERKQYMVMLQQQIQEQQQQQQQQQ